MNTSDRRRQTDVARLRALVDGQRAAVHHPNPRVVLALNRRLDRQLAKRLQPDDLDEAIAVRDSLYALAHVVRTELERLKMELVHVLGTGREATPRGSRFDRVAT